MDAFLESVLVCPRCKGELKALACGKCKLRYSITENDIPNLLVDEARAL